MLGTNLDDLRANNGCTVTWRVSCVVVVVLLLGDPEVDGFLQGGDDRVVVDVAHVGDHGLGRGSLFGKRHDAGPVLRADVVALTVELGRVVDREEDLEEGSYEITVGSNWTSTTSAWPVVPLQTAL